MKRSVAVETEETNSSTETESLLKHTPKRMSDRENATWTSESVTSEDVVRQIRAVTNPLTQELAHLWEVMKELRDERAHRRHEQTASSRAASTSTGSASWSDIHVLLSFHAYSSKKGQNMCMLNACVIYTLKISCLYSLVHHTKV